MRITVFSPIDGPSQLQHIPKLSTEVIYSVASIIQTQRLI